MIGGAALGVVLLELLFRVLPVSTASETGYYIDPLILTYPAGATFRTATGWNLQNTERQRANNLGFLADRDFVPDQEAVALIGDSYVEASMLPPGDRLAPQLERALRGRPVYALGFPGSSLLDYAERIRYASEQLDVRNFVLLLESGDVVQAICGSGNISASCLDASDFHPRTVRRPAAGTLKRFLRQSALAQYVYSQLKIDRTIKGWLEGSNPGNAASKIQGDPTVESPSRAAELVIDDFFNRIRLRIRGTLVLVLLPDADPWTAQLLARRVRENGWLIVDTTAPLSALSAESGLSNRVSPRDAHLNRLALQVVAKQIAEQLARLPRGEFGPDAPSTGSM